MQNAYFTDSGITDIILVIPVMLFMHHSAFDIFKMVSKIVADNFSNPWERHPTCRHNDGFVTDQMPLQTDISE